MTSESLRAGLISEDSIRRVLSSCRGDIFKAAGMLAVSPRELDRYIRSSENLQGFAAAIEVVKQSVEYDRMSSEQFAKALEQRTRAYRIEATDVIHEIATMPLNGEGMTAAMVEVKLKAAVQLRGSHNDVPVNSDQAQVLSELNKLYQETAPRIKSIRAVQIEYQEDT